jgi:lycopene beta-cyclase
MAGGGLAGLSLAMHMVNSSLPDQSILIVDRDSKTRNDRTWGFWTDERTLFDPVICHTWERLRVVGREFDRALELGDYRYKVIRGLDFYTYARETLSAHGVNFLTGTVDAIDDGRDAACVTVDGAPIYGRWVFDSLPPRFSPFAREREFHHLKMHFRGWEIETPAPTFTPEEMTFLDFRIDQVGEMRFFYVLPFTDQRALVEYTLFSKRVLHRADYERALRRYLAEVLGLETYRVVSVERGCVPLTDQPLPRQLGRRVMSIGAKANRVKPSTGYAFMRIQEDADEIVESMLLYGHPFEVPDDPDLYDVLDAVLLEVIERHGDHIQTAFTAMFRRNPVRQILRFLDEEASPWENLMLVASLPPQFFVNALLQVVTHQSLFEIMES